MSPSPTGLEWSRVDGGQGNTFFYAVWGNLDDYEEADSFNVRIYKASGDFIGNNVWTKEEILNIGHGEIWVDPQLLTEQSGPYRFTVQVYSSRPNEFRSSIMPLTFRIDSFEKYQ